MIYKVKYGDAQKAKDAAMWDMLKDIGVAGAGGLVMGVGMSGTVGGINYARGNAANIADVGRPQADTFDIENVPSTSVKFDSTGNYTPEKRKTIREYLGAVNQELVGFIQRVKRGEKTRPWFALGKVDSRMSADVQRLTGIDVSDYEHGLTPDDVRHVERRHGENGEADRSMRDSNDVARVQYVLENYDAVELLDDTTTAIANSDGSPAQKIKVSKKINGTYYVVEAVPDSEKKKMRIISAYISAKEASPEHSTRVEPEDITSETQLPYNADTNSISQVGGNSQGGAAEDIPQFGADPVDSNTDSGANDGIFTPKQRTYTEEEKKYNLSDVHYELYFLMEDGVIPEDENYFRSDAVFEAAMRGKKINAKDLQVLQSHPEYARLFNRVFGTDIDFNAETALKQANAAIAKGEIAAHPARSGSPGVQLTDMAETVAEEISDGKTSSTGTAADRAALDAIETTKTGIGAVTDPQAKVVSALSGKISNDIADSISNSPELAAAFEALSGAKLIGTVAQKRRTVRQYANVAAEKYRIGTKEKSAKKVQYAGYDNTTDVMIGEGGALGAFGKAVYRAAYQRTTDAYTRSGFGPQATKQYNADFGAYYLQGFKGTGYSYMHTRMAEEDARAAYEAGLKDAQIAEAATASAKSGILHGASQKEIDIAERLSRVLGKDILFVKSLSEISIGVYN